MVLHMMALLYDSDKKKLNVIKKLSSAGVIVSLSPVLTCSRGRSVSIQRWLPSRRHGAPGFGHGCSVGPLPHHDWLPDLPLVEREWQRGQNM